MHQDGGSELSEIGVMLEQCLHIVIALRKCCRPLLARGIARDRECLAGCGWRCTQQAHTPVVVENVCWAFWARGGLLLCWAASAMKMFLVHAFMRGANYSAQCLRESIRWRQEYCPASGAGLIPHGARPKPTQISAEICGKLALRAPA